VVGGAQCFAQSPRVRLIRTQTHRHSGGLCTVTSSCRSAAPPLTVQNFPYKGARPIRCIVPSRCAVRRVLMTIRALTGPRRCARSWTRPHCSRLRSSPLRGRQCLLQGRPGRPQCACTLTSVQSRACLFTDMGFFANTVARPSRFVGGHGYIGRAWHGAVRAR